MSPFHQTEIILEIRTRHFQVELRVLAHRTEAINKSELWIKVVFQCHLSLSIPMFYVLCDMLDSIQSAHIQALFLSLHCLDQGLATFFRERAK